MNAIKIGKNLLNGYTVSLPERPTQAETYAANQLIFYVKKYYNYDLFLSYGKFIKKSIVFKRDPQSDAEEFSISVKNRSLFFVYGGNRGAIYSVYTFLEKAGVRFFSQELSFRGEENGAWMKPVESFIPQGEIALNSGFLIHERPFFHYRDVFTHAANSEEWCVKMRINGETWGLKRFDEYLGGSNDLRFVGKGGGGHTFQYLVSVKEFGKTHPEYFAFVNGERKTTANSDLDTAQPCLTNEDLPEIVAEKLKNYLRDRSGGMVSVSPNDNALYCQCEKCKESYKKYGVFGTLINFVNKVAENLETEFPETLIHTYMYTGANDVNAKVKAHKNVIVQFCPTYACKCHALNDGSCTLNKNILSKLKTLANVTDNIFIYEYGSCLKYSMFNLPDIFHLRETVRTYAENNVKGIYAELCIHTAMQPTFEELRLYLFSKLLWNPYMGEEEYQRHIDEFLFGFYGKGYPYIKNFLVRWCEYGKNKHCTGFSSPMITNDLSYEKDSDGNIIYAKIVPDDELEAFCQWANGQFDMAVSQANPEERERIEIARTSLIWYELFYTMKDVLKNGNEDEKKAVIKRNKDLCVRMRKYHIKYTTFTGIENHQYMYDDFSVAPSEWRYKGSIAGEENLKNQGGMKL